MSEQDKSPHQYVLYTFVEVMIDMRSEFNGRSIKPECIALNGKKMIFEVMWLQDSADPYPNEYALGDSFRIDRDGRLFNLAGIGWISSGDVKFVRVVPPTEIETRPAG